MRTRNWRLIITGLIFLGLSIGFFFFMQTIATQSTDPVEFMRIVGQAAGVGTGISLVMIVAGLIGKTSNPKQ